MIDAIAVRIRHDLVDEEAALIDPTPKSLPLTWPRTPSRSAMGVVGKLIFPLAKS